MAGISRQSVLFILALLECVIYAISENCSYDKALPKIPYLPNVFEFFINFGHFVISLRKVILFFLMYDLGVFNNTFVSKRCIRPKIFCKIFGTKFDCYWQSLISGKETGHYVSTQIRDFPNIFLFPKILNLGIWPFIGQAEAIVLCPFLSNLWYTFGFYLFRIYFVYLSSWTCKVLFTFPGR